MEVGRGICAARWGRSGANNFQALDDPRCCHSKAFYIFSPFFFSQGSRFSMTVFFFRTSWPEELLVKLLLMPSIF